MHDASEMHVRFLIPAVSEQLQARDALEVLSVARHEYQAVLEGSRGDQEIRRRNIEVISDPVGTDQISHRSTGGGLRSSGSRRCF